MDRDQLKLFLEQGLSVQQVANLTARDASSVGYWVQKHGLVANGRARHARRGGITEEALKPLIASGATARQIADALDVSEANVRYWLRKFGLRTRNGVGRRPRVEGRKLPVITGSCPRHGEAEFVLEGRGSYRCKPCRAERVARRRRRVKEELVREAGGKCELCGYDRCTRALAFHHRDPTQKKFGIAMRGITRAIETVRREAAKCVLLCANCHAEVEAGVREVPPLESESIVS